MGTYTLSRMVTVSLILVVMLCYVVQPSPLSPAARGSPTQGVFVVIGPLSRKSLMPTFSPREAPVEGSDYALSFANKASNVNLLMEKGTDVKFEGDVDNINVEYVSSDKGNKEYECYHWTAEDIAKHNGDLEKEKEVCEAKGPAYIFTQGRNDNNPGCGNCYCCRQISGLMPTFSPREAPVEGSDYALSFENKASKVHLLMEKGTDVKFEGDVDNIYVEYVSSDKGNKDGTKDGWEKIGSKWFQAFED